jgi:hypothetical protein
MPSPLTANHRRRTHSYETTFRGSFGFGYRRAAFFVAKAMQERRSRRLDFDLGLGVLR